MQASDPAIHRLPGQPGSALLDDLPLAVTAVDRRGMVVYANAAAADLFRRPTVELLGHDFLATAFRPTDRGTGEEVLGQVLAGSTWSGELPVAIGLHGSTHVSCSPLTHGGAVTGALVMVQPGGSVDTGRAETTRLADRLTRLARVAAELVAADNVDAVTKIVINHAADAAGATVASLSLLADGDTIVLQGIRGGLDGAAARWARFPLHANTPAGDAIRTGEQVVLVGQDQIQQRYPGLESATRGERTMICLPLKVSGRSIGAVSLSFPGKSRMDAAEREFLGILADICAQAIDRMRALAEAADQTRKLEFLANASAELSSSLDYQVTLSNVARLAVPDFADWCAISLAEDGELRTIAVAHMDPEKVAAAEALQQRYPPDPNANQGSYHVLRTGASELISDITDEMLVAAARDEEHLRLVHELNLRSVMVIPLVARGRVFGVITWASSGEGRRFDRDDLVFGEDLARRAAVAIDNAELHSETLQASVRLQHAVLPERLPAVEGWDLAAHYSPSGRTEVGGDFYDVVPLDDGVLALFVGDVMGRGVPAAAAMAQMRAAVRAYVAVDPDPATVMRQLDMLYERFELAQLVTLVCLLVDPRTDRLSAANAGHPPPVVLRADGTTEQLASSGDRPIGLPGRRTTQEVPFGVGDALLAFTDGLIERRTEDIDAGQARVLDACRGLARDDLAAALGDLVAAVQDPTRDDDVAALAVRRTA